MILFLLSLLAGILTVLAPCTIALLPVIVGGTVGEGRTIRRALVVTGSLGVSVVLFTLILKVSTAFISVPEIFWQIFSGAIILLLGISMVFPSLYESLPWISKLNRGSNKLLATGYNKKGLAGDIIIGAALGPVFSSCSPTYFLIIATVLPRSLGAGIVYLLAYAIGLSGALLVVAFAGQKLMMRLGVASDPRGWIKRGIGILFIIVGIAICFGLDKAVETAITDSGFFDVTKIEQRLLQKELAPAPGAVPAASGAPDVTLDTSGAPSTTSTAEGVIATKARIALKALQYPHAPEITDPSAFINTDGLPIQISDYLGKKVILIDFWTYSCINCQRTLPYLKAWYDKYESEGLEIISIHTPEFSFEKDQANVAKAVAGFGIKYPVVMDNNYGTWNAFGNQFWPRKYLIDVDGYIVYDHAGEGNYDETEAAIQKALAERNSVLGMNARISSGIVAPKDAVTVGNVGSPETYFGFARNEFLANGARGQAGAQTLTVPEAILPNQLYLGGTWNFQSEYAETAAPASITYQYRARDVYFVASSQAGTKIHILIDGKPAGAMAGSDVSPDGSLIIQVNRLYHLVHGTDYDVHTLQIQADDKGLDAYTFTFG